MPRDLSDRPFSRQSPAALRVWKQRADNRGRSSTSRSAPSDSSGALEALAERDRSNNRDALAVDDDHLLVVAHAEQPMMRAIDRQSARLRAGRQGPAVRDGESLGIDVGDLALVFDVDEHVPCSI